ncbi:MAG: hypothetical protein HEP71_03365 [Roseivirga sp.]|nr:hypothetical protein [Roseivirga sp.]
MARKQEELENILLSVDQESLNNLKNHISTEFSPKDYILPLTFITMVTFIGLYFLFLGWSLYKPATDGFVKSVLLAGSDFWVDPIASQVIEKRSVSIVAWSILGSFLGGAQYTYRRYATIDLTPGIFFSIGIRMILAPTLSLMISFLMGINEPENASSNIILVIAFLTGLFPERGLKMLLDKTSSIFPDEHKFKIQTLPLQAIEGISYLHRLRLNEIGIDNAQNLAQFNFLMLIIKTPFPARILLDWVAQAKLMTQFPGHINQLRESGMRTALDLKDALEMCHDEIESISETVDINKINLLIYQQKLSGDRSISLLGMFNETLEHRITG